MTNCKYKRVLLKFSGEALMGDAQFGISNDVLSYLAEEVREIRAMGVEICIVIGAGNIFRGISGAAAGMDRAAADNIGMLATVMNSLALKDALDQNDVPTAVLSAFSMNTVCESYSRRLALEYLGQGKTIIFAAGTGNPYFTTDTAAVLRGLEINADIICKATKVDGVYDKDPVTNNDAIKFDTLTYSEVLKRRLKVMDSAAISLAMDNERKILVFNMNVPGNIKKAIYGEAVGTIIG